MKNTFTWVAVWDILLLIYSGGGRLWGLRGDGNCLKVMVVLQLKHDLKSQHVHQNQLTGSLSVCVRACHYSLSTLYLYSSLDYLITSQHLLFNWHYTALVQLITPVILCPPLFLLDCSSDRMSWWLSLGQGHHNLTRCCTIPTSSVELTMTDAKTNSLVLSSENWNIHKGGRGSGLVCLVIVFGFYAPFSILYVSIKVIPRQSLGAIKVVALGVPLRGRF